MPQSEVARLKQQIEEEYEAAQRGLNGLASGTARHEFITAKMERIAVAHEKLIELVGPEEAVSLVAHTIWSDQDHGRTQV